MSSIHNYVKSSISLKPHLVPFFLDKNEVTFYLEGGGYQPNFGFSNFRHCFTHYSAISSWNWTNLTSMEAVRCLLSRGAKKVGKILWRHRGIPRKKSKKFSKNFFRKIYITFSILGQSPWKFFYMLSRCMGRLFRKHFFEFLPVGRSGQAQSRKTGYFNFGPVPTGPKTKV